jgi:hypothetical protein
VYVVGDTIGVVDKVDIVRLLWKGENDVGR